jgi:hypothetical protein
MVSEQSYMSAKKWSLVVNSHLRMAFGHPFHAVEGLKEAPRSPVREHVTPFNQVGHLSVARGGIPGALRAHKMNRTYGTGKEIVLPLESNCVVPFKTPHSHRSTTLRYVFFFLFFFLNGPPPTFRKF